MQFHGGWLFIDIHCRLNFNPCKKTVVVQVLRFLFLKSDEDVMNANIMRFMKPKIFSVQNLNKAIIIFLKL
jgi:hypothetical protein